MKYIRILMTAAFCIMIMTVPLILEAATAETLTVTGKYGPVTVPVSPKSVVVMDFGMLDTVDALQKAGAISPDLRLALPESNLPDYLSQYRNNKNVTDVGGLKDFSLETIYAFKPDLIIISGRQQDFYNDLSDIAPVWQIDSLPSDYLPGVERSIRDLGRIFKAEKETANQLAQINAVAEEIRRLAKFKNLKALILLTNDGKISLYGSGSRFGIIHDAFGVGQADESIKVGIHGQLVNFEYIAEKNPDAIFVVDRSLAVTGKADGVRLLKNDLVDTTSAAKNGRIFSLDPGVWYLSGGGLESLRMMEDEVRAALEK